MKKLIIIAMAIMLVFGAVGCQNSNPLTDPTNPMNPMNPNSPLNPNNPNNQGNKFPVSEATDAIVDIINGLDKANLSKDMNTLMQSVMPSGTSLYANEENTVEGMSLAFVIEYNNQPYNSIPTFMAALIAAGVQIDQNNPSSAILYADNVALTLTFSGYTNGVKGNVAEISSGSVTLSGNVDEIAGGTAPFAMAISNLAVAMKEPAGTTYTITNASNMALIRVNDEGYMLPPASLNATFTISDGKNSQSVTWNAIVNSEKNETPDDSYTDLTPEEAGVIGYYDTFGTQHFLLALYDAFRTSPNELAIVNKDNITVKDDSFTMTLNLDNYTYARNNAPQKATGTVVLTFTGKSDAGNANIFKTNLFSVYSDGAVSLSSTDGYKNATVTYGSASDPVEVSLTNGLLEFKTTSGNEGAVTITGIKYYGNDGDANEDLVVYTEGYSFKVEETEASKIVFK